MAELDATPEQPADPDQTTAAGPDVLAAELVRVLDAYMADLQAGRTPDRERLLAEHPSLVGQLQQCLASIEFIQIWAAMNVGLMNAAYGANQRGANSG